MGQGKENRTEEKAIFIDECWQLIGANSNRLAAEFVLEIFKIIRGYGGSAICATQDMSRVAHCIDNGPMEGFWGLLKRERYYGKRFTSKQDLITMIRSYISYYNNRQVRRGLGVLTPMEKHNLAFAA